MELMSWYKDRRSEIGTSDLYYKADWDNQLQWVIHVVRFIMGTHPNVLSTHTSKSCVLPVYTYTLHGDIDIHIRGNFHDWCIRTSVKMGDLPDFLKDKTTQGYYEGMTDDYQSEYCVQSKEVCCAILMWIRYELK